MTKSVLLFINLLAAVALLSTAGFALPEAEGRITWPMLVGTSLDVAEAYIRRDIRCSSVDFLVFRDGGAQAGRGASAAGAMPEVDAIPCHVVIHVDGHNHVVTPPTA